VIAEALPFSQRLGRAPTLNHRHTLTVTECIHGEAIIASNEMGLHHSLRRNLVGLPAVLTTEIDGTHGLVSADTLCRREMNLKVSALHQRILCATHKTTG
jgi:hypothetical protein